jgi:hypothetical protein
LDWIDVRRLRPLDGTSKHPPDLAEFTRRANTEFWKMMAVEAMICAVACMVMIKRT